MSPESLIERAHDLQCMEIWNGNRFVETSLNSPGIESWVFSHPYQGNKQGGDIHYLSLCVGGIVTRILLADVAGHGERVAKTSEQLRDLLRRFMNAKRQDRLVSELNRQFTELESQDGFATAVIATFLSHKSTLLLTNAGHPRPLYFSQARGCWGYLDEPNTGTGQGDNYPFGLDLATQYEHFVIKVTPGDWLLLYTDAYTECSNAEGRMLGEDGLLRLVEDIPRSDSVSEFGTELNWRMSQRSPEWLNDDDSTLIAIRFVDERRIPGLLEKLRGYVKFVSQSS